MTVRVPKWLLWVAAAALVIGLLAVGFTLGRSGGGDGSSSPAQKPAERPPAAEEAVCSKPMAEAATLDTDFDDRIRANGAVRAEMEDDDRPSVEVPFFSENPLDYQVAVLECADLSGDGVGEMVVGLAAGASGRVYHWAIFTPDGRGRWTLAFDREFLAASSIEIEGDSVHVRTPIYGSDDPLCCPSDYKSIRVGYRNGRFEASSTDAPAAERRIVLEDSRVASIGRLAATDPPSRAVVLFGKPTGVVNYPESTCTYSWSDLGLSIDFANFGGGDPCGPAGRIAYFELVGTSAEESGWHTAEGARVGAGAASLERLYPEARRSGNELTLVEVASPIGASGTLAVMTAYLADGRALAYRFYIGAAGE
ncbi:MAG TPA: hypothetical protein VFT79_04190 [Solirubrobacterales bacterium]|nr:hypothetical protein [Solirubrobacterales bacterium]